MQAGLAELSWLENYVELSGRGAMQLLSQLWYQTGLKEPNFVHRRDE